MNRHKVPDDDALLHDIKTRVNTHHFQRLQQLLEQSHYRTMAELLRHIICEGSIQIITVDETLPVTMEQLIDIRKELNAIGNNLNQVARALNLRTTGKQQVIPLEELMDNMNHITRQMQVTQQTIAELAKVWLHPTTHEKKPS
jgi:hypothetical protein